MTSSSLSLRNELSNSEPFKRMLDEMIEDKKIDFVKKVLPLIDQQDWNAVAAERGSLRAWTELKAKFLPTPKGVS